MLDLKKIEGRIYCEEKSKNLQYLEALYRLKSPKSYTHPLAVLSQWLSLPWRWPHHNADNSVQKQKRSTRRTCPLHVHQNVGTYNLKAYHFLDGRSNTILHDTFTAWCQRRVVWVLVSPEILTVTLKYLINRYRNTVFFKACKGIIFAWNS